MKYYKFPVKVDEDDKEGAEICIPSNYNVFNTPVNIWFIKDGVQVRVGCQRLDVNVDIINNLIDEYNNTVLNITVKGLIKKIDNNPFSYEVPYIYLKSEFVAEREYYITTNKKRLRADNWNKVDFKYQTNKEYFKYFQIGENSLRCIYTNNHYVSINPDVLDFLQAIKELLMDRDKYLLIEKK